MTTTSLPTARAGWVLGLTAAAQFVLQLDFSIVNVALPTVQRELHFSPVGLQWVVTGYALTFGSLLLVGGRLGDLIGHRRSLLIGLVAFAITSLTGGLAVSAGMLVASRLAQGASAALIAPAALGLLTHAYSEPAARARALGIFQGSTAAGGTAGIVLGGILTEYAGWRWVLLVNPPVIIALVALIVRRLPDTPGHARGSRLDLPGAGLATAAIAALIFGVSEGQQRSFSSPDSWVSLAASVALLVGFVVVEARSADPMLPPALLRDRMRRVTLVAVFLLGAVFAGYVYFVSLYLQRVLGYSAVSTGVALVPATLTALIVATQVARRLLPRMGGKRLLLIALVLVGIGQLWLSRMSAGGTYPVDVLGGIVFTAAGLGLAFPTASFTITSDVAPQQRGVAGGMFVTGQQVGAAVGLAVLATAAAARTTHTGSLVDGYSLSYVIATGLIVVALLVLGLSRPRASQPAESASTAV
ncbi:MFS transporter [Jatrophihabitans sp.]|uniref:MFS transporter n=1 Tax=Jatrophihabitans sp. TaxID=1932789 RepID=UPI0030C751CD|nr:transporter [Jatrophihabitans sp.]